MHGTSPYTLIDLPTHLGGSQGALTVVDGVLPFPVIRTYWIYNADGETRGRHRHQYTRQALIAVSGFVSVFMDDGNHRSTIMLDRSNLCLLVEPKDWHTMTFGPGSVLLVMASHRYDRSEYIDTPYSSSPA